MPRRRSLKRTVVDYLAVAMTELVVEREILRAELQRFDRAIAVLASTAKAKPVLLNAAPSQPGKS